MLTASVRAPTDAAKFAIRSVAASLGVFGLLRLQWTETNLLLPLTGLQASLAIDLFGTPTSPIEATLSCSGADAAALCLGAVLAYPTAWPSRIAGAAGGAALIVGLNTVRLGTLGRAAISPAWFTALHLYVWPALLTLAVVGYVFAWMRFTDSRTAPAERSAAPQVAHVAASSPPARRFIVLAAAFLLLFTAASPLFLTSSIVLTLAAGVAHKAAAILSLAGVSAHAGSNVLWTPRGGFTVTQECIATPLIPIYLAAICAYRPTPLRLLVGVLATVPLFLALGIARLLMVALPDVVGPPIFMVHAFYQLLLGAVIVFAAAWWRHRGSAALSYALLGAVVGVLFVKLAGPLYTRMAFFHGGTALDDPQGAMAFLPAYQTGLYLALWIAACLGADWRRLLMGAALLSLQQTVFLIAVHAASGYAGLTMQVRDIRGWAVAAPVLILAVVVNLARPRR